MSTPKKLTLDVLGTAITVLSHQDEDYLSLTDMLKAKDGDFFIGDWLRNRNTVEFLGIWERVHNPGFNYGEFDTIKSQKKTTGSNSAGISSALCPRSITASTRMPSARRSSRPPSPSRMQRGSMPTKRTCSMSPCSARPQNNGAMPTPMRRATFATMRRWNNWSS